MYIYTYIYVYMYIYRYICIFGLLIPMPGKAPVTFTLTNSCVAGCKAAYSYNHSPAAAGTSPGLKH